VNLLTRRVATVGAATLALASAVLTGTAGAALAVAAPTIVATASVFGSPPSASSVATCPAGTNLVGTGGRVQNQAGGGGDVVMTDIIPNAAAGTVTVSGVEVAGFNGNWSVVAYAICDTVITGVVQVTALTAAGAASPKNATPVCPANTSLTGLGYRLRNAGGQVFPDDMAPIAIGGNPLGGANITAFAFGGFGGMWDLTGYALCAPLPAGAAPVIVSAVSAFNPNSPKDIDSGACPFGTRQTGTAAEMNGALGNVIADRMDPDAFSLQTQARGFEPVAYGNNWGIEAFTICW
jgi:hypothetical protein